MFLRSIYFLLKIYWRVLKPKTLGVKLLNIYDGKVLLVRSTYQDYYHLPGGGVRKGEGFRKAIIREIYEELGIRTQPPPAESRWVCLRLKLV